MEGEQTTCESKEETPSTLLEEGRNRPASNICKACRFFWSAADAGSNENQLCFSCRRMVMMVTALILSLCRVTVRSSVVHRGWSTA